MRRTEDNIFDNYEKKSVTGIGHIIAVAVCLIAFTSMIGVLFWLNLSLETESGVVPEFEEAIDQGMPALEKQLARYKEKLSKK